MYLKVSKISWPKTRLPNGSKLIVNKLSEYGIDTQLELLSNTNKKGEN